MMGLVEFLIFGWALVTAILKFANLVDWSWWFVFGPLFGYIVSIVAIMFIGRLITNDFED